MSDDANNPLHIDTQGVSQELKIRPEIYLKIVRSFSGTLTQKMADLREALEKLDRETIRKILHEIKGTSSNLRLHNVMRAEALMHDEIKGEGNPQRLAQCLSSLSLECDRLQEALARMNG